MTKKKQTAIKPGEPEIRCAGCHDLLNGKDFKNLVLSGTDGLFYEKLPEGHLNAGDASFDPGCFKDLLAYTAKENQENAG